MISHITLGTNDLERATAFYSPIMEMLGLQRVPAERSKSFVMWTGADSFRPMVALTTPQNGEPHHPGNGQMLALLAPDRETVARVHAAALEAGGEDEGAPGLRPQYHSNYFGAYFRDLDGNKLCIVCHDAVER